MAAPYRHGENFVVFISQKLPLSKTIIVSHLMMMRQGFLEPDIDDNGGVVEGEQGHAKEPNVNSAVSLVNARKRKGSCRRDITHEKDISPPKQEPALKKENSSSI